MYKKYKILRRLHWKRVFTIYELENADLMLFEDACDNAFNVCLTKEEILQLADELRLVAENMEAPNYEYDETDENEFDGFQTI